MIRYEMFYVWSRDKAAISRHLMRREENLNYGETAERDTLQWSLCHIVPRLGTHLATHCHWGYCRLQSRGSIADPPSSGLSPWQTVELWTHWVTTDSKAWSYFILSQDEFLYVQCKERSKGGGKIQERGEINISIWIILLVLEVGNIILLAEILIE